MTDTSVVRNLEGTIHQFQKLRQLGIRISIDDFGTGLSSLSYLHQLPVDALKIDRAFVEGLGRPGRDSLLLVRAIVGMAHGLQLEVVAEGVQTQAQLKVLQNESCDLHQGFLFYKPMRQRTQGSTFKKAFLAGLHPGALNQRFIGHL